MISGPGKRFPARLLLGALLLLVAFAAAVGLRGRAARGAPARRGPSTSRGRAVHVPAGYRVVRVAPGSRTCVRLDRRVVYLGGPSTRTALPGRGDPRQAPRDRRRPPAAPPAARRAASRHRPVPDRESHRPARRPREHALPRAASVGGSVFTGLGFDTCSAPSTKAMAAWAESPFRGVGIYIGGENSACSQPNLSASWVSAQTTAGWHLIPTYVGLQATTSSCSSCAKMTTAAAATQGAAAAEDAVTEATAIGIGTGSPIYFDMEAYTPSTSATNAVLTFLEAWTEKLHAARLRVRRLLLERLRDRRPRRPGEHRLPASPTTSGSPTGTARKTRSTR